MNFYKDYNQLIRKLDRADDKEAQAIKNFESVYYKRLNGTLRIKYNEYLNRMITK